MGSLSTDGIESIYNSDTVPQNQERRDKAPLDTPNTNYVVTSSTSASKKWDVTSKKNLKSRNHALIANVPNKYKLELVQLKKRILEAKIAVKKKVWEFEENERKREAELKVKKREVKEKVREFKEKVREFKENERRREAEFKEKEREFKEKERKYKEDKRKREAEFKEKEREFKEKEQEFKENERKKEAEFKENEWKWKEEEYKLKLQYNLK